MLSAASSKAEEAGDSASLVWLARAGLIAYGVVHLLIGWLAVRIAWSAPAAKSADTSGALKTLAREPFGDFLLALVAFSLLALALWQVQRSLLGLQES